MSMQWTLLVATPFGFLSFTLKWKIHFKITRFGIEFGFILGIDIGTWAYIFIFWLTSYYFNNPDGQYLLAIFF